MTFLPFLVLNLLLASVAAHVAFRLYESGRMAEPARVRARRRAGR